MQEQDEILYKKLNKITWVLLTFGLTIFIVMVLPGLILILYYIIGPLLKGIWFALFN